MKNLNLRILYNEGFQACRVSIPNDEAGMDEVARSYKVPEHFTVETVYKDRPKLSKPF